MNCPSSTHPVPSISRKKEKESSCGAESTTCFIGEGSEGVVG